jgi:predicted small lipoprotein YifL
MSRICLAMLSVVALAACGDSGQLLAPTPPTTRADAAAVTETESFLTPYNSKVFVSCANGGAGEVVKSTGTIHRVIHVTETANGFHLTLHANPQNVSGTGLTTGDTYQTRGTFNAHQNFGPGATETIHETFMLVGPGPDNNLRWTTSYHLTINANGEITIYDVEPLSIECS